MSGKFRATRTPVQDKHVKAFVNYIKLLEKEGLTTTKEIYIRESQPSIFILKPQIQEITDENLKNVIELALRTVSLFERGRTQT